MKANFIKTRFNIHYCYQSYFKIFPKNTSVINLDLFWTKILSLYRYAIQILQYCKGGLLILFRHLTGLKRKLQGTNALAYCAVTMKTSVITLTPSDQVDSASSLKIK
jgi:hypothetical protein